MELLTQAAGPAVLLTGGTGYLGALVAEVLLCQEPRRVLALVRDNYDLDSFLEPIAHEAESKGQPLPPKALDRLTLVPFTDIDRLAELEPLLRAQGVEEIVHCAGCVDYFDSKQLEWVNVVFTERLLELAVRLKIKRFTYLSTAYSAGYVADVIAETPHVEPSHDPTEYTRTKREAENEIIHSGVPYLILRPAIVVGDSRSGRYGGKRYGLYQQWMGLERLLCDRYHDEFHVVAPRQPINFVHQDAFQNAFYAAFTGLPDDSIVHLTSHGATSPTMRDLWDLWLNTVNRPQRIVYYGHLNDVPLKEIHPRQRAYLMFASVNLQIASHYWAFETSHLDGLRERGLAFADATLDSVALCQRRFIASSPRLQQYLEQHRSRLAASPEVIDLTGAALPRQRYAG